MRPLGEALGLDVHETAEAVIEVATANMYVAFSNVLARHGLDPRDFALVAFGGAGPVEACFLAEEFHIPRVIVPPSPGTLCAQGAMMADVKSDYVKTIHRKLSASTGRLLAAECAELSARATRWLAEEAPAVSESTIVHTADLRYVGQAFQIEVPIDPGWLDEAGTDRLRAAFHDRHERLYAHADRAADVELIDLRATITGATPKPAFRPVPDGAGPGHSGRAAADPLPQAAPRRRGVPPARSHGRPAPRRPGRHRTGRYDHAGAGGLPCVGGRVRQPRDRARVAMAIDRVTLEILRNHYQAVVEDMARIMERTAYTTFVKETADFSTGLVSTGGEYVAYPWSLGASSYLGLNMVQTLGYFDHYDEGDIVICNDAYLSGPLCTHLPDIHILRPIFHEGRVICWGYALRPLLGHRRRGAGERLAAGDRDLPGRPAAPPHQALPAGRAPGRRQEPDRRQLPHSRRQLG